MVSFVELCRMMASDLDEQIANSEPAALRVGDAMRLLPLVLLRHDARVQRAYDDWRARMAREEQQATSAMRRCCGPSSKTLRTLTR